MVTCSGFIDPFNLSCIFVNAFAGSIEIFMFIALMVIAGMGAYFRMLNATLLIMFAIFGLIMAQFFSGILFLTILIGGIVTAISLSKIVKA